jgi:hypothetical protein
LCQTAEILGRELGARQKFWRAKTFASHWELEIGNWKLGIGNYNGLLNNYLFFNIKKFLPNPKCGNNDFTPIDID